MQSEDGRLGINESSGEHNIIPYPDNIPNPDNIHYPDNIPYPDIIP